MESEKISNLELIDISTEDDFLIDSRLCDDSSFQGFRLSVAYEKNQDTFEPVLSSNRQKVVNSADIFWKNEEQNQQNGECNMRKSLAWDRAFFTDAGVLNPEELSMINKGFKKTEVQLLPGIAEELQSSAESNFTIGTNSFSIDSLEIDLFKDFTESNQNLRKTSFGSSSRYSSGKGLSAKKLDVTPRHPKKPLVDSTRQSSNTKGLERKSRERKATGSESKSSSLRTPKLSGHSKLTSAFPNKRASFGNAVPDPKKPCLGKSCSSTVTPGSTIRPYSSGSSAITGRPVSCYSYDRSGNVSSSSMRRKIDSGKVHNPVFGSQSSVSISSIRNKTRLNNSTCKSMPKMSFCLSPSSPMDHCSLESSSDSSIFNSKSKSSMANMNVTPSKGTLGRHPGMSPVSEDVSSRLTPSGLRFPLPRIGYFDVEKSRELTPKELQFSGQQCNTAKSETQLRTTTGSGNNKSILKQKNASQETKTQLKSNDVSRKLHASSKSGLSTSSKSDEKGSHLMSTVSTRKGVQVKANTPSHIPNIFNATAKKVHEEDRQRRIENSRHLAYVSGKENLFRKEDDGVDGLSKQLGSINLSGDVVIELA